MKTYFITGIGTDVGKTIVSAICVEALEADYWKPVQAGDLDHDDTCKVKKLVSNSKSVFHPNRYALKTPMSPHAAAAIDGIEIDLKAIKVPKTNNHLVIEGAGGLLVPLNDTVTVMDMMHPMLNYPSKTTPTKLRRSVMVTRSFKMQTNTTLKLK